MSHLLRRFIPPHLRHMDYPVATGQHCCDLLVQMVHAHHDRELCDFELVCDGRTIQLHKLVIFLQSPVIRAACTGSFKEAPGRYELKDCDFDSVQRMVMFLYTGDYHVRGKPEEKHEIAVHMDVFALADKYLIDELVTLSNGYFYMAVMKENDMNVLAQHAPLVYDLEFDSSQRLREILVEVIKQKVAEPTAGTDMQQPLARMMDEVPQIGKDIALSYIRQTILAGPCIEEGTGRKRFAIFQD